VWRRDREHPSSATHGDRRGDFHEAGKTGGVVRDST
jgi:hypothetical protein